MEDAEAVTHRAVIKVVVVSQTFDMCHCLYPVAVVISIQCVEIRLQRPVINTMNMIPVPVTTSLDCFLFAK